MNDPSLPGSRVETLLGQIANEFTDRLNRGEKPDAEEYYERHPELSSVLRGILPALATIQRSEPGSLSEPNDELGIAENQPIGDFRLIREIGRGGMGVVYEAVQLSLNRRVALKILPFAAVLDPRRLARFQIEAQAAAQLHHSNIVAVHAVGCDRNVHYYAMQYVEGNTLADVIRSLHSEKAGRTQAGGPRRVEVTDGNNSSDPCVDRRDTIAGSLQSPESDDPRLADASTVDGLLSTDEGKVRGEAYYRRVAQLGIQIALALEYAHERGIVHRDIKPANLLLDRRGNLSITDFGLAQMGLDSQLTLSGDMLGTLPYMSPEAADVGEWNTGCDHRTDIYSLGVTLYELLTGHPPFEGPDRIAVLRRIADESPKRLRAIDRTVPMDLETIVLKCLEKSPNDRYPSAQSLAEDLRLYLEHRPIRAKRPKIAEVAFKWSRRHRTAVYATSMGLSLAILAVAVAGWIISDERSQAALERTEARLQRQIADSQKELAEDRQASLQLAEYVSRINLAEAAWARSDFEALRQHLEHSLPKKDHPDFRGFEWYHLKWRLDSRLPAWARHVGEVYLARFSPAGDLLATAGQDGVRIWNWAASKDLPTAIPIAHLTAHKYDVNGVGWSLDGKWLATASDDHAVRIFRTDTWQALYELPHNDTVVSACFAPDGERLVTAERQSGGDAGRAADKSRILIWNTENWTQAQAERNMTGCLQGIDVSTDGQWVAGATRDGITVWNLSTDETLQLRTHPGEATSVAFLPRTSWVAGGCNDGSISLWNPATGESASSGSPDLREGIESVASSSDGKSLLSASRDGSLRLWDVSVDDVATVKSRRLFRDGRQFWCAQFAGNAGQLVSTGADGAVKVWDENRPPHFYRYAINTGTKSGAQLAFSPDGKRMAVVGRELALLDLDKLDAVDRGLRRAELPVEQDEITQVSFDVTAEEILFATESGRFGRANGPDWNLRIAGTLAHGFGMMASTGERGRFIVANVTGTKLLQFTGETPHWQDILLDGSQVYPRRDWEMIAVRGREGAQSRELLVYDWKTKTLLRKLDDIGPAAWSPDGSTLAVEQSNVIRLWNAVDWDALPLSIEPRATRVDWLAFSPDSRTLAGACFDGKVKLWNRATGRELLSIDNDGLRMEHVEFSPDGRFLAGTAAKGNGITVDYILYLWEATRDGAFSAPN